MNGDLLYSNKIEITYDFRIALSFNAKILYDIKNNNRISPALVRNDCQTYPNISKQDCICIV